MSPGEFVAYLTAAYELLRILPFLGMYKFKKRRKKSSLDTFYLLVRLRVTNNRSWIFSFINNILFQFYVMIL